MRAKQAKQHNKKDIRKKRVIILTVAFAFVIGIILFAVLYLGAKFGLGALSNHRKTTYAENTLPASYLKNDWKSKWIWCDSSSMAQWVIFRKDIVCDQEPIDSYLDIATDTHYWLWINGELEVFEGNAKRGATPNDGYYDHVETNAFVEGMNNITLLVNYLGDSGYSHKDSGHGGLRLEGRIGDVEICSDDSFFVKEYKAYQYKWYDFAKNLNFRLAERSSTIYGGQLEEFWLPNMDCSTWNNATILDDVTASNFGLTYLNVLPPKYFSDIIPFVNSSEYINHTFDKKQKVVFKLPYNLQFTPYFELYSEKETKITYYVNDADTSNTYPLKSNYKNVYHTVCGNQSFEDYSWQNGEYLIVEFPKGVTLLNIGYRISSFGCQTVADNFTSNDEFINTLYKKAVNTLNVTMRDNYMDCPDRERAQWIGDAAIESEMAYYALSPQSSLLFKKAILTLYGWQHENGVFQTVAPDGVDAYELPQQNLAAIVAFEKYLLYTGDYSVFDYIYQLTFDYLRVFEMKDGLVKHRAGSWDWGDWGKNADIEVLDNAWYYYALGTAKRLASYSDNADDLQFCIERMKSIEENFNKEFWHEDGYRSKRKPDDRANALALICGLADEGKYDVITDVLTSVYNSSPYMEKYVEEALCIMNRSDLAVERARNRYADMVSFDGSTLWELWDRERGTANHAWSGGTLVILAKYVCGIRPTEAGYDKYEISPDLSVLDGFSYKVNPQTDKYIEISSESTHNGYILSLYTDLENGTLVLKDISTVMVDGVQKEVVNGTFNMQIPIGKDVNVIIGTE